MAKHADPMPRKKIPNPGQGALQLDFEEPALPAAPDRPMAGTHPPSDPVPVLIHRPTVPSEMEPVAFENTIEVNLQVWEQQWSLVATAIGEGGELLAEFENSGVVTADGVKHSGWVIAANEAMSEIRRRRLSGKILIRIPESKPVGYLVVTLPSREQVLRMDPDQAAKPYPAIYSQYLELTRLLHPRIIWDFKAKEGLHRRAS